MINRLISSVRSRWIFVLGMVAISAGFTAKNVISYPTECMIGEVAQDLVRPDELQRIYHF